jgi:hypothetical protein
MFIVVLENYLEKIQLGDLLGDLNNRIIITNCYYLFLLKNLAERQGFEPWEGYKPSTVFKTVAFNRSATSP